MEAIGVNLLRGRVPGSPYLCAALLFAPPKLTVLTRLTGRVTGVTLGTSVTDDAQFASLNIRGFPTDLKARLKVRAIALQMSLREAVILAVTEFLGEEETK